MPYATFETTGKEPYGLQVQRRASPLNPEYGYFVENLSQDDQAGDETRPLGSNSILNAVGQSSQNSPPGFRHRPPPIAVLSRPSGHKRDSSGYYDHSPAIPTGDTLINDDRNTSYETLKVSSSLGSWLSKDRGANEGTSARTSATEYEMDQTTYWIPPYGSEGYAPVPRATHFSQTSNDTFERPIWGPIGLVTTLCIFTYPFLRFVAFIATNQSLFWARTIVSLGCGVVGFTFSIIFNAFASRHLAACTWATVIHKSRVGGAFNDEGPGIRVRDLARVTEFPTSIWSGIRLLFLRMSIRGAGRAARGGYDGRPWSLFIIFFLFLVGLNTSIPFIYGRIVIIDTVTIQQSDVFDEVFVWGELSAEDLAGADNLVGVFSSFAQTWTLAPFASLTDLPSAVSFFDETSNHSVYFADSYASQLRTDGSALGTFKLDSISSIKDTSTLYQMNMEDSSLSQASNEGFVQFPKWGIRIQCAKIPDSTTNILPFTVANFSYVFVTEPIVQELFANLSLPYPSVKAVNLSTILQGNDTLPESINASSVIAAGYFYNNGVAHSFKSVPVDMGASGHGWIEIEIISARLNTSYTPNGTFPVYSEPIPDADGNDTWIGFDSAVCVEVYEPWVVETFNATGTPPSSIRLLGPISASASTSINSTDVWDVWTKETTAKKRLHAGEDGTPSEINWTLNSTGKVNAFAVAHDNSINQMVKDNGRDFWYVPSPLLVSFTNGSGPEGYTELSADLFASGRALADATNVLPFLAGTGSLAARIYPSKQLARVHIENLWFFVATGGLLVVGLIAGFCVPRLPLSVPRRGFDLISWLAVLHGDEMVVQLPAFSGDNMGLDEKMTIEEIDEKIGDVRVKYKV